jgi:SagB-type dehydrogenase family enzyme
MLNSARVILPQTQVRLHVSAISLLLSRQPSNSPRLNLTTIACLLNLSAGLKPVSGKGPHRWVPSGGNLGSIEAFLIARQIDGIAPGAYLYMPEQHALARLNQRGTDHVEAVLTTVCPEDSAPALLVFAGGYGRIARKYGAFAYKLLHLDAGVSSSQLLLVAAAMSVPVESVSGWNPIGLGGALAMRHLHEVCAQVFRIAPSLTGIPHPAGTSNESNVATSSELELLAELPSERLVEHLMSDSLLVGERLPTRIKLFPKLRRLRLKRSLLGPSAAEATLGSVLNTRSSIRRFAKRPICAADLQLIVRAALANNVMAGAPLTASVLVRTVEGLEAGVYVYHAPSAALKWKRNALPDYQMRLMFFQSAYEETPVIVWISGDVGQVAGGRDGGYQTLLVRAGLLGHRLWMASVCVGLSGVLVAGITAEVGAEYDELIPPNETSLIAFLCGYAPTTSEGEGCPDEDD